MIKLQSVAKWLLPFGFVLGFALPASAWIVYDPNNFVENQLSAVREEISNANEEINNAFQNTQVIQQATQLSHELTEISNQVQQLSKLPEELMSPIATVANNINEIKTAGNNVIKSADKVSSSFSTLTESMSGKNLTEVAQKAMDGQTTAMTRYQTSANAAATWNTDIGTDLDNLSIAVANSRETDGDVSAMQAGNEINALAAQQTARLALIEATRLQNEALEKAEQQAAEKRAAAVWTYVNSDLP